MPLWRSPSPSTPSNLSSQSATHLIQPSGYSQPSVLVRDIISSLKASLPPYYLCATQLNCHFTGILSFVNCYEVKWATFIQDIFTYAKLLALFIIIGTGIVQLGRGKTENFTWVDTETDITKIALSFYSGELSNFFHCSFNISSQDSLLTMAGTTSTL